MAKGTSRITVTENNRTFSVVVPRGCGADAIHIDAPDYAHLERRCDYAIRVSPKEPRHFFFVELKGNRVFEAADQLECAMNGLRAMYAAYGDRQAWIIAKEYPACVTARLQKRRALMKRDYGFDLKWQTRSFEVNVA